MSNKEAEDAEAPADGGRPDDEPVRQLLDPARAEAVEAQDRGRPIPGGEPACPLCGITMVRHVEKHPAPRGGSSPFRIRLVCRSAHCGAWTVYDW
jgi:hypothetical protein